MLIALTILDIILSLVRTVQTRSWNVCVCVKHLNRCKTCTFIFFSGGVAWSHRLTKTLQVCCDMQSGRRLHVPALVIASG